MEYALEQARRSPRAPTQFRVGAILVNGDTGQILSSGYSSELSVCSPWDPPSIHAEHCCLIKVASDNNLSDDEVGEALPDNTIMYTTMEPCMKRLSGFHSCVDRILKLNKRIKCIYVGIPQPGGTVPSEERRSTFEAAGIEMKHVDGMHDLILEAATAGQGQWSR
jgi:pyrimidine deaminase RibD-like protein